MGRITPLALVFAASLLAGCAQLSIPASTPVDTPQEQPSLTLIETKFSELPGWGAENYAAALPPLLRSCTRIEKRAPGIEMGNLEVMGTVGDWQAICNDARQIRPGNNIEAKYFFESRFAPYIAMNNGDTVGLFTGYYETQVNGRWAPELGFNVPIYSRPTDIISIDLGAHRQEYQGTQLAGRIVGSKLAPYYSREEINGGALNGQSLEILWADDPIDVFFMHIQGSGRVLLPDGSHVRLGYAGRNGHRYTSIGRELVAMDQMRLEDVTAPAIRQWLRANPAAGQALMNRNASYVFFRVIEGEGPIGAQGVPLTAGRSLAVDDAFIPYGVPVWLETTDPLTEDGVIQRLMLAQDTGSAIVGPVRGDVFWGFGDEAALRAGLMKEDGRYFLLLPRSAAVPEPTS